MSREVAALREERAELAATLERVQEQMGALMDTHVRSKAGNREQEQRVRALCEEVDTLNARLAELEPAYEELTDEEPVDEELAAEEPAPWMRVAKLRATAAYHRELAAALEEKERAVALAARRAAPEEDEAEWTARSHRVNADRARRARRAAPEEDEDALYTAMVPYAGPPRRERRPDPPRRGRTILERLEASNLSREEQHRIMIAYQQSASSSKAEPKKPKAPEETPKRHPLHETMTVPGSRLGLGVRVAPSIYGGHMVAAVPCAVQGASWGRGYGHGYGGSFLVGDDPLVVPGFPLPVFHNSSVVGVGW